MSMVDKPVGILEKAARMLEALAESGELKSAQLAERMGEPRSSVYRYLKMMENVGWIEPASTKGSWRISLRLFRLSSSVLRRSDLYSIAHPHLQELNARTEQTVFLCVREDWSAVCVDRIAGLKVANVALRLGGTMPLHQGAAPQILLAFAEHSVRRQWLDLVAAGELPTDSLCGTRSVQELTRDLDEIRARGYSISDQDVTRGIVSIGAPILDARGKIVAAISLSGLREQIVRADDPTKIESSMVENLLLTAQEISEEFSCL